MLKRILFGLAVIGALAVAPAAALAAGPHWTKNGVEIAPGKVEKVETKGKLSELGEGAVGKCVITDEEIIENPTGGAPGVDKMLSFKGKCVKGVLWPCTSTEIGEMKGITFPWLSVLSEPSVGVFVDEFKGVEIEVECLTSKATAIYKGILKPELLTNKLVFGPGSGELKSGIHGFTLKGIDKLKLGAGGKLFAK